MHSLPFAVPNNTPSLEDGTCWMATFVTTSKLMNLDLLLQARSGCGKQLQGNRMVFGRALRLTEDDPNLLVLERMRCIIVIDSCITSHIFVLVVELR